MEWITWGVNFENFEHYIFLYYTLFPRRAWLHATVCVFERLVSPLKHTLSIINLHPFGGYSRRTEPWPPFLFPRPTKQELCGTERKMQYSMRFTVYGLLSLIWPTRPMMRAIAIQFTEDDRLRFQARYFYALQLNLRQIKRTQCMTNLKSVLTTGFGQIVTGY